MDTYTDYLAVLEEETGSGPSQALPVRLNLKLDHGFFDETEITNLYLNGIGNGEAWNLDLKSDVISGAVEIPGGTVPVRMNLEYLNLPGQREPVGQYDASAERSIINKQSIFEAGSFVYVPKGTLHTFKNIDAQQGRLLVTITPAGLEDFFYRIGTPAADLATPPAFDPGVIDKLMQLAKDYQLDIRLPEMK